MFDSFKSNRSIVNEIIKLAQRYKDSISRSSLDNKTKKELIGKIMEEINFFSEQIEAIGNNQFSNYLIGILEQSSADIDPSSEAFSYIFRLPENEKNELLAVAGDLASKTRELLKRTKKAKAA